MALLEVSEQRGDGKEQSNPERYEWGSASAGFDEPGAQQPAARRLGPETWCRPLDSIDKACSEAGGRAGGAVGSRHIK